MELFKVAKNLYAQTSAACVAYVKGVKAKDLKAANVAKEAFTKIQADKREFQGADRLEKVLKQIILAPLSLALRICLLAMNHKIAKQPVAVAPAPKAEDAEALLMKAAGVPLPKADEEEAAAEAEALMKKAVDVALPKEDKEEEAAMKAVEAEALLKKAAEVALPDSDDSDLETAMFVDQNPDLGSQIDAVFGAKKAE
jgi:hypothetical protein